MSRANLLLESLLVLELDARLDIAHAQQDQDLFSKCVDWDQAGVHHGVVLV
jgi:hypothetical protein